MRCRPEVVESKPHASSVRPFVHTDQVERAEGEIKSRRSHWFGWFRHGHWTLNCHWSSLSSIGSHLSTIIKRKGLEACFFPLFIGSISRSSLALFLHPHWLSPLFGPSSVAGQFTSYLRGAGTIAHAHWLGSLYSLRSVTTYCRHVSDSVPGLATNEFRTFCNVNHHHFYAPRSHG